MAPTLPSLVSPFKSPFSGLQSSANSTPSFSGSMAVPTVSSPASSMNSQNMPLLSPSTPAAPPSSSSLALAVPAGFNNPMSSTAPKPAVPSAFNSSPTPVVPNIKMTPSGAVVNAATGGVMGAGSPATPTVPSYPGVDSSSMQNFQNANPGTTFNSQDYSQYMGQNGVGPTAPTVDPYASPLYTSPAYESALKTYQSSMTPTDAEIQNQKDIANLNTSLRTAYTNTEGQAIPLDFITGQERRLQQSATDLSAPLQATASMLQARRTAALDASKFALDQETNKIAAYREANKPVSVPFGSSLVNPQNGKTNFGGNGAGSAMDKIGTAISEGRLTPDQVTRYGAAAIASALDKDPGYNFVTQKASVSADSASLKTQQGYLDTTTRAYNTATDNLGVLTKFMTDNGINQSDIPVINQLTNKVKAGALDPGAVAAFQSQLQGLRAEYSQVLARGGVRSVSTDEEAASLIPDNLSPSQMAKITTQLSLEGQNAIKEAQKTVDTVKNRTGTNMGKSTSAPVSMGKTQFYQDPKTGKWTYK